MQILKALFIKLILPIAIVIILFITNPLLGFLGILLWCGYQLYSNKSRIYAIQATSNYSKGNLTKSLELFKKATSSGKVAPAVTISYGYLLLKTGNIVEAEKVLTSAINSNILQDEKMMAKSNLALVLWKKDQLDDAVTLLEEVIENYKTTSIYGSLGFLLILKGDLEKALSFNQEAFEYNSQNSIIIDNLAHTYYLIGEYDKAQELFEKLMALTPPPAFAEAYYDYGLLLKAQNKKEEALAKFEKAQTFKLTFLSAVSADKITEQIKELTD